MKNDQQIDVTDGFDVYALPGTSNYIVCQIWNVPNNYIKMNSVPPKSNSIALENGEWKLPEN